MKKLESGKNGPRTLQLAKDTLRTLQGSELQLVAGGAGVGDVKRWATAGTLTC